MENLTEKENPDPVESELLVKYQLRLKNLRFFTEELKGETSEGQSSSLKVPIPEMESPIKYDDTLAESLIPKITVSKLDLKPTPEMYAGGTQTSAAYNLGGNLNAADFEQQIRRMIVELVKPVLDRQEVAHLDSGNLKRKLEANNSKMNTIELKLKSINNLASENA